MHYAHTDLFAMVEPDRVAEMPALGLRYYQQEAREAVARVHEAHRGALVVLPTGTGKSRLLGAITWDGHIRHQRALVLCPTITLVRQMYSDLRKLGLNVEMEQASNRARRPLPPVVVACVASMRGDRLASFDPYDFDRIGVDEAHRCISPLYEAIFAHFHAAKLIGLTATPSRSDGVSLGNVFEETAYTMTMLRAISEGWLVPLRFKTAVTDFDPKALRTLAGEVDPSSVAAEITRSGLLHEAANTLAELSAGERTVAFLPTVASSKAFVAELIARGIEAAHVDASTPEQARNEMFAAFAAGTTRVIANVGILCEGWDMPACSVVALLNPTKSWQRLTQMIGRITRLAPGKEFALVLDFCPGRLRKGRLASPADALAGKMLDDAVHDQMATEGDLATAIADAETSAAEIEEKKRKALEKAEARKQRVRELAELARKKKYRYGVQDHDAAAILGGAGGEQPGEMRSHDVEPSEDELRKAAGICSVKQSHILRRWGLNPRMSRALAGEVMGALSETNWQVLPERIKNNPIFKATSV
jgi:superfamily II DNA or RNA helicase